MITATIFARFDEALGYLTHVLQHDTPYTHAGTYYQFYQATMLPRPQRPGGPPILIGGSGPKYTLPRVVRFANEWNAVYCTREQFAALNAQLTDLLAAAGRDPGTVRRSMMTGLGFGRDAAAVRDQLGIYHADSVEDLRARGVVAGTAAEVIDQLSALAEVGVQRVMLQWLDLDDLDGLEAFARAVLRA